MHVTYEEECLRFFVVVAQHEDQGSIGSSQVEGYVSLVLAAGVEATHHWAILVVSDPVPVHPHDVAEGHRPIWGRPRKYRGLRMAA